MGRLELAALQLLRKTPSRLEMKTDRLQETMQYRRHTRVSCPPRALDLGDVPSVRWRQNQTSKSSHGAHGHMKRAF